MLVSRVACLGIANPILRFGQRRLAGAGRFEILQRRRHERQFAFRQARRCFAVLPDDRERLAPVALAREEPVAQLVIDRRAAESVLFEPGDDLLLGFGRRQAVDAVAN